MKKIFKKKDDLKNKFRVNDEIRLVGDVRIVGEGMESRVMSIFDARKVAEQNGMDMVELQSNGNTPIIRICHYDKMLYEMKKAAKKNKAQAKPLKEIQLSVNIAKHDLETKANNARRFLEDGSKVKVVLSMRGREVTRREESKKSLLEFIVMLEDIATIEGNLRDEGNKTIVILKRKQ